MVVSLALAGWVGIGETGDLRLPFAGTGPLVTNEYAYWNLHDPARVESPVWEVTSGSLFRQDGHGWTGVPDAENPDAASGNGSGSAVFRLTSKRADFLNVAVSFDLQNEGLVSTDRTPPAAWDGVHLFLRYQDETSLYYATVNRRDSTVAIKKKVPGGPSNGGTYHDLGEHAGYDVPYGAWQHVRATIEDEPSGAVAIRLYADGRLLTEAVDDGVGGDPIRTAGRIGVRGDNCQFLLRNFVVSKPT